MSSLLLLHNRQANQPFQHQLHQSLWQRHSVTTPLPLLPTCRLGPVSMWGIEASRSALASSLRCRQANSVASQASMPTPTFRTDLSSATPSSGSVCFPFPSLERRNNGFIRTRKLLTHGKSALRHSLPSFSP